MRTLYLVIASSLMVPAVALAVTAMPFHDVPLDTYYYQPVISAIESNVIEAPYGYNFYPAKALTRADFIYYMVRTIGVDVVTPTTPTFSDVPKTAPLYSYIETGKKLGLVSGTQTADGKPTGKFEPYKLVNRAEAAVIIMKAFSNVQATAGITFPDLKNVSWAVDAINRAATVGFFHGYPDKTFGPGNEINNAEGITVLMQVHKKLDTKELTLSFNLASATVYSNSELLKRAQAAVPNSIITNVQQRGNNYFFFYSHTSLPQVESYVWYVMSLDSGATAIKIYEYQCDLGTVCPYGIYAGAPGADGADFILINSGEIVDVKIPTLERTSFGSYFSNGTSGIERYRYPFYTPDNRYFIMQDAVDAKLVVLDDKTKTITSIDGFAASVLDPLTLENGGTYSLYKMLDANRVQFRSDGVLNLSTMTKE